MPGPPARVAAWSLAPLVLALVLALTDTLGASPPDPSALAPTPGPTAPPPVPPAAGCRASASVVTAAYRAARTAEAGAVRPQATDRLAEHFAGPALIVARRAVEQGTRPLPGLGPLEVARIDAGTVMVTEQRGRPPDRAAVLRCGPAGWRITEAMTLP